MVPPQPIPPLTPLERKVLAVAAELAESISFSGTAAQIYALLYIRKDPLPLGDIAALLEMSKGNASILLRTLESWGAVRKSFVPGSRRDHYEPTRDLKSLALRRLEEGFSRRMHLAEERLNELQDGGDPESAFLKDRLKEIRKEVGDARRLLKLLPSVYRLGRLIP